MKVKVIQINIFAGKYFDQLLTFLKKELPDFITMQEVTTKNVNLYHDKNADLFEKLKAELKMDGVYSCNSTLIGDLDSKYGIAVFSKFPIIKSEVIELKKFRALRLEELMGTDNRTSEEQATNLLDTSVDANGKNIHVLSWHGAWTAPPHDTEETLRQAELVRMHLKKINGTFVLGGDLNNIIGSKTIDLISSVANNLMVDSGVEATTNRKVHKIRPRGYLIDYIFTSPDVRVLKVDVPEITVSDHLPVIAGFEI